MTKKENSSNTDQTKISSKQTDRDTQWSFKFLLNQFKNESDRAAVILVASILDETLQTLLKSHLVPIPNSDDSLFDNATSPLSTFSAKIDICYRIGLISGKFSRDIHIVRKIRNSFAHDIYGCSFENGSVISRIKELENSFEISKRIEEAKHLEILNGYRGMFLFLSSCMIFYLNNLITEKTEIKEQELEWFYINNSTENIENNTLNLDVELKDTDESP
jgi:DNA-binding MltR family transcriptional regulator